MHHHISFDAEKRVFVRDGKECRLRRGPTQLCVYLMQSPGVIRNRDKILEVLHGEGCDIFDRTVDSYVKRARIGFRDAFGFDPIQTAHCVGYYWSDGTSPQTAEPRPNGGIWCDRDRQVVMRGDKFCRLTNMQFQICAILSSRPGVIKSRDFFIDDLCHDRRPADKRVIDSVVQRARRKMERALDIDPIKTSYGFGYYWENPPK